jgi:glycosyltransferase involved in cell wall biosynthesis
MLRCLWISRDLPFPLNAGDKIYSANLARSLAEAGAQLRFAGFPNAERTLPVDWPIEWLPVAGSKRHSAMALLSTHPIQASIHSTQAYQALIEKQFAQPWDAIVFDSYGSGWALQRYLTAGKRRSSSRLIYISHNHEVAVWRAMAERAGGSPLKRLSLWQNYLKVRALEREVVRNVDLITTITPEDAAAYATYVPDTPRITLTPGYSGWRCEQRTITADTPRRVVMVGSFRWRPKQENLRQFLQAADTRLAAHGIALDVVGDIPQELKAELQPTLRATVLHGFVDDISGYFSRSRLAVVPEIIGGGFKLKFLDYIFGRVPVATLDQASIGLPEDVREHVLRCSDLDALTSAIIAHVDNIERLNDLQANAHRHAVAQFQWIDRGRSLMTAIERQLS